MAEPVRLARRVLLAALLATASLGLVGCGPPPYTQVDNAELEQLRAQGVPVYDIRRPEEWRATGVIEGSRLSTWQDGGGRVNPDFMATFGATADKSQPVVLICRTGNRTSQLARDLMEKHGYTRVYNVEHGIAGWIAERRPVVKPPLRKTRMAP
ncbi:MAG TPA: rhodanese-like domain-containing protein [Sulfuricaulis sp.]|nr:rhodanese-like domain-containing protein [Sulfuricaulis sp.]